MATAKKAPAKKKGLTEHEEWAVEELIRVIENDESLYFHLYSNWYNNYAKKKAKGKFDREAALKGMSGTFCNQCVTYYNKKYAGGGWDKIRLSKEAKAEFGKKALALLNAWGLRNVRVGSKPREHENPTIGTRANFWAQMR